MSEPVIGAALAFGKVANPDRVLGFEGKSLAKSGHSLGRQAGMVQPGVAALQLNSGGWMRVPPELAAALPEREDLRTLCIDRLEVALPAFAGRVRRWVYAYLDSCAAQTPQPPTAGQQKNVVSISDPSDQYFAALLPLPMAHIRPVYLRGTKISALPNSEFVRFDLAFWDGKTLTGVVFGGPSAASPATNRARQELERTLGTWFVLRHVETLEDEAALATDMLEHLRAAPEPWLGPYRARAFSRSLT